MPALSSFFDLSNVLVMYESFRTAIGGVEWFAALYFIILICFFVIGKDYMNDGFVYPFAFMALTIFNPFLIVPIAEVIGLLPRIRRLFWLLPVNLTIAYVFTCLTCAPRKKFLRPVVAVILAVWVIASGTSVLPYMQMPDNLYKTTDTIVKISELLDADTKATGLAKHALYSSQQLLELRQYDPSIQSILRRSDLLTWEIDSTDAAAVQKVIDSEHVPHILALVSRYRVHIDRSLLLKTLDRVDVNYIITDPGADYYEYLTGAGFEQIGMIDGYGIYRIGL